VRLRAIAWVCAHGEVHEAVGYGLMDATQILQLRPYGCRFFIGWNYDAYPERQFVVVDMHDLRTPAQTSSPATWSTHVKFGTTWPYKTKDAAVMAAVMKTETS